MHCRWTYFVPDTPIGGQSQTAAETIAKQLCEFVKEYDLGILAVGGDSTNLNTGWKGGAIHFFEVKIGQRVVWLICLLHTNELPLDT